MTSYVAAPVMPAGRVIGLLRTDCVRGSVTAPDRDVLWSFSVGFGETFERAVLMARLREQRDQMRSALQAVEEALDGLASAEIELGGHGASRAGEIPVDPSDRRWNRR